jgi:hypothetical protein
VSIVLKSGSLNILERSGPVKACNGIALPLLAYIVLILCLEFLATAKTGTSHAYFETSNCHVLALEFLTFILSPKSP